MKKRPSPSRIGTSGTKGQRRRKSKKGTLCGIKGKEEPAGEATGQYRPRRDTLDQIIRG